MSEIYERSTFALSSFSRLGQDTVKALHTVIAKQKGLSTPHLE